ncbi:MAG: heme-binding protein [Candidatus Thermoplasmatota archaeon]|nr:heme-binding protein [Candidatus Thermoplasmatota archaeon]
MQEIEIRHYPSLILAVVTDHTDNTAFNLLFQYLSGSNRTQQKIPMTAPVITQEKIRMVAPVISHSDYMAFVLPTNYSQETVPIPINPEVKIETIAPRYLAVLRFKGTAKPHQITEKIQQLHNILNANDIPQKNSPFLM